jgi:nucleoside-diphosphate-sugar epimerase
MSAAAITGAAGYVGSAIARCFRGHGWEAIEMGRRSARRYELRGPAPEDWSGVDALVHCAWDFTLTRWEEIEAVNVRGSIRLLEAAHAAGVRRGVFISSLSCFPGCRSLYGRGKLIVEKEALGLGYAVVRPGLVYGEAPGGMMGALAKAAKSLPVVPMIGSGRQPQYPVHEEDLAELIYRLCGMEAPREPIAAAEGEGIAFRELLRRIAAKHGRKPLLMPVPWRLILAGLKTMEAVGMTPPFRSDSLLGFVFQNPAPDFSEAKRVGGFRGFEG